MVLWINRIGPERCINECNSKGGGIIPEVMPYYLLYICNRLNKFIHSVDPFLNIFSTIFNINYY
jgi:hypothetical protein